MEVDADGAAFLRASCKSRIVLHNKAKTDEKAEFIVPHVENPEQNDQETHRGQAARSYHVTLVM